jgi:thiosulfate/3-mercaptopyruvate sulfurtransferase
MEMHADATGISTRFDLPERPRCETCHWETLSETPGVSAHKIHREKVACQVCHGIPYKNCFGCHVGTDDQGRPYYKSRETKMLFKVGINPRRTKERPYEYVVLRHPPADPDLFAFYLKDALSDFDKLPTWKMDTPHNIQRTTEQNRACNNCHGRVRLFLRKEDLRDWERKANAAVVVPPDKIPTSLKDPVK